MKGDRFFSEWKQKDLQFLCQIYVYITAPCCVISNLCMTVWLSHRVIMYTRHNQKMENSLFLTLLQRRKSAGGQWRSCARGSGCTAWSGPCSLSWDGDVMARSPSAYPALWPGGKWKMRDSLSSSPCSPSTSPCLQLSSSAATLASP